MGITLSIPDGAQIVEGAPVNPLTSEEEVAFETVFESDPETLQQQFNKIIFTLGFYLGPIEEGADGSIAVSAISIDPDIQNHAKDLALSMLASEEAETDSMSFSFIEKLNEIKISEYDFFVSKGILKLFQDNEIMFEMPINYYLAEFNGLVVTFTVSGNKENVRILEKSLLEMKIH